MSEIVELKGTTKINVDGRVLIPSFLRKPLGLKPGDEVTITYKDGSLTIGRKQEDLPFSELSE